MKKCSLYKIAFFTFLGMCLSNQYTYAQRNLPVSSEDPNVNKSVDIRQDPRAQLTDADKVFQFIFPGSSRQTLRPTLQGRAASGTNESVRLPSDFSLEEAEAEAAKAETKEVAPIKIPSQSEVTQNQ